MRGFLLVALLAFLLVIVQAQNAQGAAKQDDKAAKPDDKPAGGNDKNEDDDQGEDDDQVEQGCCLYSKPAFAESPNDLCLNKAVEFSEPGGRAIGSFWCHEPYLLNFYSDKEGNQLIDQTPCGIMVDQLLVPMTGISSVSVEPCGEPTCGCYSAADRTGNDFWLVDFAPEIEGEELKTWQGESKFGSCECLPGYTATLAHPSKPVKIPCGGNIVLPTERVVYTKMVAAKCDEGASKAEEELEDEVEDSIADLAVVEEEEEEETAADDDAQGQEGDAAVSDDGALASPPPDGEAGSEADAAEADADEADADEADEAVSDELTAEPVQAGAHSISAALFVVVSSLFILMA